MGCVGTWWKTTKKKFFTDAHSRFVCKKNTQKIESMPTEIFVWRIFYLSSLVWSVKMQKNKKHQTRVDYLEQKKLFLEGVTSWKPQWKRQNSSHKVDLKLKFRWKSRKSFRVKVNRRENIFTLTWIALKGIKSPLARWEKKGYLYIPIICQW